MKFANVAEVEEARLLFAQRRSFTRRGVDVKESYLDVVPTAALLRGEGFGESNPAKLTENFEKKVASRSERGR